MEKPPVNVVFTVYAWGDEAMSINFAVLTVVVGTVYEKNEIITYTPRSDLNSVPLYETERT